MSIKPLLHVVRRSFVVMLVFVGACTLTRETTPPTPSTTTSTRASTAPATSGLIPTAQAQNEEIALTVYNQNLALVRDVRSLALTAGVNEVRFADVAAQIDPTSVHVRSLTNPGNTRILEQNFDYDLVGSQKLLEKYIDKAISVVTDDGTTYEGTLLSAEGDLVLKTENGIVVVRRDAIRQFDFPALPDGLITRPSLVWLVEAQQTGEQDMEVTYMTGGISWRADYVVQLNQDDTQVDLNGWVTLENQSGATYENAKLKLVAGDVNVVQRNMRAMPDVMMMEKAEAPTPQVEERQLFEYHLYDVQRPVTVRNNQTKQIEFTSASGIDVEKIFVYDGAPGLGFYGAPIFDQSYGAFSAPDVNIYLDMENSEENGLGIPLPAGRVRVYKADVDGTLQFVGEDTIDHTPRDERVRLRLGNAFDIVGERRQTNFRRLGDDVVEESFEITIRNHKDEAVEVRVVEHLFRWSEWEITRESDEHTKLDQGTVEWRIDVPANGEATVTYTVRYEF